MDELLDGQVAVVTGAGSGIGRAVAGTFARAGATVIAADIAAESARDTVQCIEQDGGRAVATTIDVGSPESVDDLAREVSGEYGRIDVLCNNAGVVDTMALPEAITPETWERVMRVNLTGPFLLTRAVLPHMVSAGHGSIVNIASEAGLRGGSSGAAYTASKHGVVGLTRNVAWAHVQDGVRCNAICPGMVETNIAGPADFDPEGMERLKPVMSLAERLAQPQAIADVALFLATERSSFVNGAVVPADGGWSAG